MKTEEQYESMVKRAAFHIVTALNSFRDEPEGVRSHLQNAVMQRVQRSLHGEKITIEGVGLVTEVPEEPAPINTPPTGDQPSDSTTSQSTPKDETP